LAALMAMMLEPKANKRARLLFGALALGLIAQSMLTFSRSGLYNCVAALAVAVVLTARNKRLRQSYLVFGIIAYLIGVYVVFPRLNDFTGGALGKRFAESQLTGRDKLIRSDLDLWAEHPLFGVGPGLAIKHRALYFRAAPSHCEISRMLAEHGSLGLIAFLYLLYRLFQSIRLIKDETLRGAIVACVAYALFFMASNAMRVVAPSLLIGFAFASNSAPKRHPDRR